MENNQGKTGNSYTSKTSRTIFVGGIPIDSTAKSIISYLSSFDKVEKIQIPKDPMTGILKGYAKAVLATTEGVRRITSHTPHFIGGLKVGILKWQNQSSYLNRKDRLTERKVHIRVPPGISKSLLNEYFSSYGQIEDIVLKIHPFTKEQRNFCYVIFEDKLVAQEVVDMSPHSVLHYKLHCSISRNQQRGCKEEDDYFPQEEYFEDSPEFTEENVILEEKNINTTPPQVKKAPCISYGTSCNCFLNQASFGSKCFCHPTMSSKFDTEKRRQGPLIHPSISDMIPEHHRSFNYLKHTSIPHFHKGSHSKFRLSGPIHEELENVSIRPTQKDYFDEMRLFFINDNHEIPGNIRFRMAARRVVN